nr:hypothetical protein [Alcaligenes faecalis]
MALLKCPECKKKFSDKAQACPSCGAPLSVALEAKKAENKNALQGLAIIAVVAVLFAIFSGKGEKSTDTTEAVKKSDPALTEIKLQRLAREYVTANLKDPGSAEFRNQKSMCGEVNAKNSFGGMTGYTRFIAARSDFVVMENDPALERGAFSESWDRFCK